MVRLIAYDPAGAGVGIATDALAGDRGTGATGDDLPAVVDDIAAFSVADIGIGGAAAVSETEITGDAAVRATAAELTAAAATVTLRTVGDRTVRARAAATGDRLTKPGTRAGAGVIQAAFLAGSEAANAFGAAQIAGATALRRHRALPAATTDRFTLADGGTRTGVVSAAGLARSIAAAVAITAIGTIEGAVGAASLRADPFVADRERAMARASIVATAFLAGSATAGS